MSDWQCQSTTRTVQEPAVEAAAVALPPGAAVIDTAFYKRGQLALLLQPQAGGAAAAGGGGGDTQNGSVALLSLDELEFTPLPPQHAPADILQVGLLLAG